MAIKFEKIQAGMTLWSRGTYRNGMNRPTKAEWPVTIIKVDSERRRALASRNSNPATWWTERLLTRLYTKRMAKKETT